MLMLIVISKIKIYNRYKKFHKLMLYIYISMYSGIQDFKEDFWHKMGGKVYIWQYIINPIA